MSESRASLGKRAEDAVAEWLSARGFVVLARNRRLGRLELDIVARQGELVAIVEVRTRGPGSFVGPFASVGPLKRAALVRAAHRLWREELETMPGVLRVRIDVAAVSFAGGQTHIEYQAAAIVARS